MFFIFLFTVGLLFLLGIILLWIGSKVFLSIKRQNRKFELETEKEKEKLN